MTELLIGISVILLLCIIFSKMLFKLGVPTLLIFLVLGMLAGSDGIGGFYFDDYKISENLSSIALVFIMFYGGFGTNWNAAKPIAPQAVLLSSFGTAITAFLTGLFCYYVLKFSFLEGMLVGSVIASTDAASVFGILRSQKLGLKNNIAPLLEVESGSNDPFSYMMTMIVLALMAGSGGGEISVPLMLFKQIVFGGAIGAILGIASSYVLRNINFEIDGFYLIFATAVAILGYSVSSSLGGNGFLCVYISGIILGNSKIFHRKSITAFFDGVSWLMQITLFFVLGLLSFPSRLPSVAFEGSLIAIFMIIIARPIAVFSVLSWFKTPIKNQLFISWVGIRGAASVVFAIYAVTAHSNHSNDIFHIVFFVVLFSILLQGSFIPTVAKKLGLIDPEEKTSMRNFADYDDETYTQLMEIRLEEGHQWANKIVMNAEIPDDKLIVMIKRKKDIVIPNGSTMLLPGDILVLSGDDFQNMTDKTKNTKNKK